MDSTKTIKEMRANQFKFGTKAETLDLIASHIAEGETIKQHYFTIRDFETLPDPVVKEIQKKFSPGKIVVRSSSLSEDGLKISMAGQFKSVLDVDSSNTKEIREAIEAVKQSYLDKQDHNEMNQILIQPQIQNALMSGVMFTKCPNTGSPYIIINYDDKSGRTDSVTSGNISNIKMFTYYKKSKLMPSNPKLAQLIRLASELETITGVDKLDVEFAFDNNNLYVLQVRPLTSIKYPDKDIDRKIESSLEKIREFIQSNNRKYPNLFGYKAIFGLMPDWNPAEIIGESPKPLALSLYKELITDHIWPLSRKEVGYKDVGGHPGMVSLEGKPYVDVRLSFNTFIPATLSETTSEKLVNFYIDKLINNPEMHDKVEFKIAHTCYKFGFDKEIEELRANNFTPLQIKEIKKSLLDLTNKIVWGSFTSIEKEMELIKSLRSKRERIINSDIPLGIKIAQLVHDCKFYGTLPFSKLARFAFVGNILLSSLVDLGELSEVDKENFFKSINSIAKEFILSLNKLKGGEISKQEFLNEFGHLRPGTYDLCSKTYNENFEDYFNLENVGSFKQSIDFDFGEDKKQRIQACLEKEGFNFGVEKFLKFVKDSLVAREKSKLEFTKSLSLILDFCCEYMKRYGFTKEEVTFITIQDIISFSHMSKPITNIKELRQKVEKNKEDYKIVKSLRLPPLIYRERNIDYFHLFDGTPNYITSKSISGEVVHLNGHTSPRDIENKIVAIVNADPGYDWVFGYNIKGLITKYGGAASHMAIRCAELDIPAAIGCGGSLFDHIKKFGTIELNCSTNQIKGIS
ncbi:MAG: PEP/pyruvate-binding domain-containing protein [Candidatus Pacearchaeota archaeon]|nr:PEP/pyruvate-binding domain-containing protein [Candidatus Pacearchaeota archaeon]